MTTAHTTPLQLAVLQIVAEHPKGVLAPRLGRLLLEGAGLRQEAKAANLATLTAAAKPHAEALVRAGLAAFKQGKHYPAGYVLTPNGQAVLATLAADPQVTE